MSSNLVSAFGIRLFAAANGNNPPTVSSSRLRQGAVLTCSLALASVPIFSSNEAWSNVPQLLAVLGSGLALLTLLQAIPRLHVSICAYALLVACWGVTLLSHPEVWPGYQSLLKVCLLGIACHLAFRSSDDLVLLFGLYCATGPITLAMNWGQLHELSASLSGGRPLEEADRFAGTFGNANTAGIYGIILIWSAVILMVGARRWWRWVVASAGIAAGLASCFFSGSRKAMLALGLLVLLVPWVFAQERPGRKPRTAAVVALGAVLLGLGAWLLTALPFVDRLFAPFTQGLTAESSGQERIAMLLQSLDLWQRQPLLGCGFDGFSRLSDFGVYSHTTFSEVLCNGGLLGLGLILVFYAAPPVQLWRLIKITGPAENRRVPAALFGFWALFMLFSCFAVLLDSRELIPISAAVCGYIQTRRQAVLVPAWEWPRRRTASVALGAR